MPGTEPTMLMPGAEPTMHMPGTEPTLVPDAEPTLMTPGNEPTVVMGATPAAPDHRRRGQVGYLMQAYLALERVDPAAAERLLRDRGFGSFAELHAYEQRLSAYWAQMRAAAGKPDPSLNKPHR
jgi:hypothetical protein